MIDNVFIEDILCPDRLVLKWDYDYGVFKTIVSDLDFDCYEIMFFGPVDGYRIKTKGYDFILIDDLFEYRDELNVMDALANRYYELFFSEEDNGPLDNFNDYIDREGYIIKLPNT